MPRVQVIGPVRNLNAEELGVGIRQQAEINPGSSAPDAPILQPEDPRLVEAIRLLQQFGGLLLSGPPGTGKTWLAAEIAHHLSDGDTDRRAFVQFHASYQFEDFMEGYRPNAEGKGFELKDGIFRRLAESAIVNPSFSHVIVIDELSRADVGRVFGEALTYVERSKRGLNFTLPSGRKGSIPPNLFVVATMNPQDRGVDEVDAAFERRFAKMDMPPDHDALEVILDRNGLPEITRRRLLAWFRNINNRTPATPMAAVGHAYFINVVDEDSLRDVWEYQLKYLVDRAFQYDRESHAEVVSGWNKIFNSSVDTENGTSPDGGDGLTGSASA